MDDVLVRQSLLRALAVQVVASVHLAVAGPVLRVYWVHPVPVLVGPPVLLVLPALPAQPVEEAQVVASGPLPAQVVRRRDRQLGAEESGHRQDEVDADRPGDREAPAGEAAGLRRRPDPEGRHRVAVHRLHTKLQRW